MERGDILRAAGFEQQDDRASASAVKSGTAAGKSAGSRGDAKRRGVSPPVDSAPTRTNCFRISSIDPDENGEGWLLDGLVSHDRVEPTLPAAPVPGKLPRDESPRFSC
ncbi:MAG: hypothetical protein R3E50_04120 [Halioglobus sp.]